MRSMRGLSFYFCRKISDLVFANTQRGKLLYAAVRMVAGSHPVLVIV